MQKRSTVKSKSFIVVQLGEGNQTEIDNAILSANMAQKSFNFISQDDVIHFNEAKYILPNGGLDLDKAVKDLLRRKYFKELAEEDLILITSKPYSDRSLSQDVEVIDPLDGFYFSEESVTSDPNIALISTYIWERLPPRPDLPALSMYGERTIIPYIILMLAVIALVRCVKVTFANHLESRGCPFDYCYNVADIDMFFKEGRLCEECNKHLESEWEKGSISIEQIISVKRLLNLAVGREVDYGLMSCFISYGQPDLKIAERLYNALRNMGIKVWLYEMNSTAGKRIWKEIKGQMRSSDRLLVICSSESLRRDGVLKEIETQVDDEPDKIIPISIDDMWHKPSFRIRRGKFELKQYLVERTFVDLSKLPFRDAIGRLVMSLVHD